MLGSCLSQLSGDSISSNDNKHWAQAIKAALILEGATISSTTARTVNDKKSVGTKADDEALILHPSDPSDASSMEPILHGTTASFSKDGLKDGLYQSMEEEFKNSRNGHYWGEYEYVVHQLASDSKVIVNGLEFNRDEGHAGMSLKDFANMDRCKKANLSLSEVAACRLIKSHWFLEMNKALRTGEDIAEWSTSVSMLISALLKLSVLSPPKKQLYRGIKRALLAEGAIVGSTLIEPGFLPCSSDPNVAVTYSGNASVQGVILCVESTFSCRAGYIGNLSQIAEDSEWTFPPNTAVEILDIEKYGNKTLVRVRPALSVMRHYTTNLRFPWSSPKDPLTWEEYDLLEKAIEESSSSTDTIGNTRETKFSSSASDLVSGIPKIAALGLEAYMKQSMALPKDGVLAIENEFKKYGTKSDKKWFKYIMYEKSSPLEDEWGIRDYGREGLSLNWFHEQASAKIAGLRLAHVLALRLYTCPVFSSLNNPLRRFLKDENGFFFQPLSMAEKHRFPVTIAFIDDGIRKLRAVEAEKLGKNGNGGGSSSDELILWRGMRDMKVTEEFMRNGGVEMACMSTSTSIKIGCQYSLKGDSNIIFRIISKNFMDRGANIEFLSCFPKEKEYLFAPLTFLSPTGRSQWVGRFFIIEVLPRL